MTAPAARTALAGAVLTACVGFWAATGDQTGQVARFLAAFGLAFAAYVVSLRDAAGLTRRAVLACVGASIVWRAALVAAPPLLSDDVNRYVWEGRVQNHGGNP